MDILNDLMRVAALSIGSVAALFLLCKLIGYKQMSNMSLFDYVTGISIGSIAAEMATADHPDFLQPLLAMVIYALAAVLISMAACRSLNLRRLLIGHTLLLFEDGNLYKKNLARAKMDASEFLTQCRLAGFFDLADIQSARIEPNGRISILPKECARPATPQDLSLNVGQSAPAINVVLDGEALPGNLRLVGKDEAWLGKELARQGIRDMRDVFLATVDGAGNLRIYMILYDAPKSDAYQ
ncbi:MAG: DUF421 domain-containing protein [Candidatus Pelethousia sp.]|nr:DUF421 domain-containing protein [Candidatus Pelethousia sp.]